MALGIAPELSRCIQQKKSSKNDETVENGSIRRMPVLVLFRGTTSMKKAMRQMTLFSMVSSNWDDSFGSEHLPSDI